MTRRGKILAKIFLVTQAFLLIFISAPALAAVTNIGAADGGLRPLVLRSDGSLVLLSLAGAANPTRVITEVGTDNAAVFGDGVNFYVLKSNGDLWSATSASTSSYVGRGDLTQTIDQASALSNWAKLSQLSGVKKVQLKGSSAFAIDGNDHLWSWGMSVDYWTAPGSVVASNIPIDYTGKALATGTFPATMLDASIGTSSAIALTSGNEIYAWATTSLPTLVTGLPAGKTFTKVFTSNGTYFAIASDNSLYTWGNNGNGEMLNGTTNNTPSTSPTLATETGLPSGQYFVSFSSNGNDAFFGVTNTGDVYGWGFNTSRGILGTNASTAYLAPPAKLTTLTSVVEVSNASSTMFAVTSDGTLYNWGSQATAAENVPVIYNGVYDTNYNNAGTNDSLSGDIPAAGINLLYALAAIAGIFGLGYLVRANMVKKS